MSGVKNVRKNSKKPQALLSSGCQTEAEILELCSNNNRNPQLINSIVFSSASQTIPSTVSNASQTQEYWAWCEVYWGQKEVLPFALGTLRGANKIQKACPNQTCNYQSADRR